MIRIAKELKCNENLKKILVLIILVSIFVFLLLWQKEYIIPVEENSTGVFEMNKTNSIIVQPFISTEKTIDGFGFITKDICTYVDEKVSVVLKAENDGNILDYYRISNVKLSNLKSNDVNFFRFDKINLEIGTKYYIYIIAENFNVNSALELSVNDNIGEFQINDHVQKGSIAYYKCEMSKGYYVTAILFIYILLMISSGITVLFNKKSNLVFALSLIYIIFILFIFGIINNLIFGTYLIYISSILSLSYYIFKSHKIKKENNNFFINTSTFMFVCFALFIFIINKNRLPIEWDDFSHWQLVVRNMYTSDMLQLNPNSTVYALRYPPSMPLIQYFVMNMCGKYLIGINFAVYQIVLLGFGYTIIDVKCFKNNILNEMIKIITILFATLIVYENVLHVTYIDTFLGFVLCYMISSYFIVKGMDRFKIVSVAAGLFTLILTKETGFLLSIIFLVAIIIDVISTKKEKPIKKLIYISCFLAIIIATYGSWICYININNHREVETSSDIVSASGISINSFLSLFDEENVENTYNIIDNFSVKIIQNSNENYGFRPSYISWLIILSLTILIIGKKINTSEKIRCICIWNFVALGYLGILLIAYLFTFKSDELTSFTRYSGSLIIAYLLFTIGYCFSINNKKIVAITLSIVVIFSNKVYIGKDIVSSFLGNETKETRLDYYSKVLNQVSSDERIYFISQWNDGINYWKFRYLLTPCHIQNYKSDTPGQYNWWISPSKSESSIPWIVSCSEFEKKLLEFDYVYIDGVDANFVNEYGILFTGEVNNNTLYKINKKENQILLTPYAEYQ